MDEQLAAIYGTGQSDYMDESDLEKTAAAELLVKLAEEQGVDLNDFSDEEVGSMLSELYGGGIEHTASSEEGYDEYQEKFAEADYLGRIMAHSMVQELDNIEKEAGRASEFFGKAKGKASEVWGKAKTAPEKTKGFFQGRPAAYRGAGADIKSAWNTPGAKEKARLVGSAARKVAPELGTAAGIGAATAGGVALHRRNKKKQASALESLAEERAYELAKEAGYIEDEYIGKEASALDYEVERRALEICEENGIPVEWNE